jgi:hypothetical protein
VQADCVVSVPREIGFIGSSNTSTSLTNLRERTSRTVVSDSEVLLIGPEPSWCGTPALAVECLVAVTIRLGVSATVVMAPDLSVARELEEQPAADVVLLALVPT